MNAMPTATIEIGHERYEAQNVRIEEGLKELGPCPRCQRRLADKTDSEGKPICWRCAVGRIEPFRRTGARIGRNDPCPCQSGKKHKHCCRAKRTEQVPA